jgi:Icc-related predicted phosphoesterase
LAARKPTDSVTGEASVNVLTVSDIHGDVRRSLGEDVASRKLDVDLILLVGDLSTVGAVLRPGMKLSVISET